MFVGEAPGEIEDRTGIPFAGTAPSGGRLRKLIKMLDLQEDCYITNAVKCRPPGEKGGNRSPTREELASCLPFLEEEIREVQPRYLVLLGATAIRAVTGDHKGTVASYRGRRTWRVAGIPAIATYHPAATLAGRDPGKLDYLIQDFNRLSDSSEWDQEKSGDLQLLSGCPRKAPSGPAVAFDLETTGLDWWNPGGRVLCGSWSTGKKTGILTTEEVPTFLGLLEPGRQVLVGHNLKFDLAWARMQFGFRWSGAVFDTMVAAHMLDENDNVLDLGGLSLRHTPFGIYWAETEPLIRKGKVLDIPLDVLTRYCGFDSAATYMLYEKYRRDLRKDKDLFRCFGMKMHQLKALLELEIDGLLVDDARVEVLSTDLKKQIRSKFLALRRFTGPNVNVGSQKQLVKFLFEDLGFRPEKLTQKGADSTDKEVLERLLEQSWHPFQATGKLQSLTPRQARGFVQNLIAWRKTEKLHNTYIVGKKGVTSARDPKGRIHPTYKLASTVTGRLSAEHPNIQNIPREASGPIRAVFVAPPGKVLLNADYSQLELRITAYLTRDPTMLQVFRDDRDLHSETARLILGHDPTKDERHIAKTCNFCVLYGGGPKKLAAESGLSPHDASAFIKKWYQTFPQVAVWQKEQEQKILSTGQVRSLWGRIRRLPGAVVADRRQYEEMMRQACNSPIQSTAADLTVMGLVELQCDLPRCRFIATVHDSILCEVPQDQVTSHAVKIKYILEDPGHIARAFGYNVKFDVPLKVDLSVGPSWGEMEELKL
jgi:DNA polymerase-1